MLEFHTLFYKTNERGPLSVENSRVTKGLNCHTPQVSVGASHSKWAFWAELSYISQEIMEDV